MPTRWRWPPRCRRRSARRQPPRSSRRLPHRNGARPACQPRTPQDGRYRDEGNARLCVYAGGLSLALGAHRAAPYESGAVAAFVDRDEPRAGIALRRGPDTQPGLVIRLRLAGPQAHQARRIPDLRPRARHPGTQPRIPARRRKERSARSCVQPDLQRSLSTYTRACGRTACATSWVLLAHGSPVPTLPPSR
jgi:hypothetical protein